jgi:hypothetical protein
MQMPPEDCQGKRPTNVHQRCQFCVFTSDLNIDILMAVATSDGPPKSAQVQSHRVRLAMAFLHEKILVLEVQLSLVWWV